MQKYHAIMNYIRLNNAGRHMTQNCFISAKIAIVDYFSCVDKNPIKPIIIEFFKSQTHI